MTDIVGIDLGTTNSVVACFRGGVPEVITNSHGQPLTPSAVGLLDNGELIVGKPAVELSITRPEACARFFKRTMGTDQTYNLGSHRFSSIELSSFVLKSLKNDAETYLNNEVKRAVITVPAYFNNNQREATKIAGELAGLNVLRVINEPTAAALAYGFHERDDDKIILVYDLGGGTFDVSIMEIFDGTLEIISTAGESFLGGEDFTDHIAATVLKSMSKTIETMEMSQPKMVSRLKSEVEKAKLQLTLENEVTFRIPDAEGAFENSSQTTTITKADFLNMCEPLVRKLNRPLNQAIRDSGKDSGAIDNIILMGGATRMPFIRELIVEKFKKDPLDNLDPDLSVALGAAVQTALIEDQVEVEDLVVTDVCPFTLGVEISKKIGHKYEEGYYTPIINRNSTIPTVKEQSVFTIHPNQEVIDVRVYQGESRKVSNNLYLGNLEVSGIPKGPAGQELCIRFAYDINGILEVEAYIPDTGKKFNTVITQHVKNLTEDEIQKALRKIQKMKFFPREDLSNKNLLLFAERIVGEIPQFERPNLEEHLDAYEDALMSTDRDHFESVKQSLLIYLSTIGFPFDQ